MDQPQHSNRPDAVTPADALPPDDADVIEAPPPPPLSPGAWLANNAVYLLIMAALVVWAYRSGGIEGVISWGLVILGLGFLIFVHELGHFLAAKWCDVHVKTFSVGFGPALPGCSFKWGETTYMLAVFPLGGYVHMVGEGTEEDGGEDSPRSFKRKSVGQRMLIISAGVIMNLIVGAICFMIVYRMHGVPRPVAAVGYVDAGSPAWKEGVRSGSTITHLGKIDNPYFDDLKVEVAFTQAGQTVPFVFVPPAGQGEPLSVELLPRKDANDGNPVIGVTPRTRLRLATAAARKYYDAPYNLSSPAAAARVIDLGPGDRIVGATDPDTDEIAPLPEDPKKWTLELTRRMGKLRDKPMVLSVVKAGGDPKMPVNVGLKTGGFDFDDRVIGTTDPKAGDLFAVKELPKQPDGEDDDRDPFAYHERMVELAGKFAVVQVMRDSRPVNVLVPPAFHRVLGVNMQMGKVAAIRKGSPAEKAGVQPGDILERIAVEADGRDRKEFDLGPKFDPTRLPYLLEQAVGDAKNARVTITVSRSVGPAGGTPTQLPAVEWDASWTHDEEVPFNRASPMAIPQLGVAYWVESTVAAVTDPETAGGLAVGDEVQTIRFRKGKPDEPKAWTDAFPMYSFRDDNKVYDEWAHYFLWTLQQANYPEVQLEVPNKGTLTLTAAEDTDWPLEERGLLFLADTRLQKADNLVDSLKLGGQYTWWFMKQVYLSLNSIISGRISANKNLGGPLTIATQAFQNASDSLYALLLFMGVISINLAVINFLPIPVLDGGHMVFLIYEKIRGRPPSEAVQAVATYIGLALLLALIAYVFFLDIARIFFGWFTR